MALEFRAFDDARLRATRDAWVQDVEMGWAFPSEVERLFAWIKDAEVRAQSEAGSAKAYGVFQKGKPVALGICEVVVYRQSAGSKWVKMLRLHLRPSVDNELQGGKPDSAIDVFGQAMLGSVGLQFEHKATTLKVYGRTNSQLNFLRAVASTVDARLGQEAKRHARVTIDGRFLSIVFSR